ncbi:MAG: hypothetical protein ACI9WU_002162 [Myxococcota bacterium]
MVYCKRSFAGADHVYRYLSRYTHRVGLSDGRLTDYDGNDVTFRTRGERTVTLRSPEFIRRFLLHVLPHGFVKIRHYGLLANTAGRKRRLARALIPQPVESTARPEERAATPPGQLAPEKESNEGLRDRRCSVCQDGVIVRLALRHPSTRGPPLPQSCPVPGNPC